MYCVQVKTILKKAEMLGHAISLLATDGLVKWNLRPLRYALPIRQPGNSYLLPAHAHGVRYLRGLSPRNSYHMPRGAEAGSLRSIGRENN